MYKEGVKRLYMNSFSSIAELLGEQNIERLKDGIIDLLLDAIKNDLDTMNEYLIDFDDLFDEVRREVFENVKDKMVNKYTNEIEMRFEELMKQ